MSKIAILKVMQIIYIVCIASYVLLVLVVKFKLVHDSEGIGLLWGITFGTLFTASLVAYIGYSFWYIKKLGKIDWVFFIFSLLLVLFWIVSTFLGFRDAIYQAQEINKTFGTSQQPLIGTLYADSFDLPVSYFTLKTIAPMMKENANIQIDPNISDGNFSSPAGQGQQETMYLMSFNIFASGDKISKEIDQLGYRPANIDEFLAFVWNEYESLKNTQVTSDLSSINTINGLYEIPVFVWVNGVPTVTLRNQSIVQGSNEYSLVVKK